jgi:hypothetical protein
MTITIKKQSYPAGTSHRKAAKLDKDKIRRRKKGKRKSPKVEKIKYKAIIPAQRLEIYAGSKAKLNRKIALLRRDNNEVIYL